MGAGVRNWVLWRLGCGVVVNLDWSEFDYFSLIAKNFHASVLVEYDSITWKLVRRFYLIHDS